MRLVSLTPTTTEYAFALGLGSNLVGVTAACDWPPKVTEIQSTGPVFRPDSDLIDSLAPDVVLAHASAVSGPLAELAARGHRLELIDPVDVGGVLTAIDRLGRSLEAEEAAELLTDSIRDNLDRVARLTAALAEEDRPWTVRLMEAAPIIIAGAESFMTDVIRRAGGRNPACAKSGPYPTLCPEELVAMDPEVVYLCGWPEEEERRLAEMEGWGGTRAVREGRVVQLICGLACRPGPRIGRYVESLARALHPELFNG